MINFSEMDKDTPEFFGGQKKTYNGEFADSTIDKNKPTDYQPVTPYNPLDIERAKKSLSIYEDKIDEMAKHVNAMAVNSNRSVEVCTAATGQAADLAKKIDANRKGIVDDAYKFYKGITAFGNIYIKKLDAVVAVGKEKIGAYQYEKEMQRREAEAKAQKEQARLQAQMDERAKKAGVDSIQVPDIVVPQTTGPVRTESATASVTMQWAWEIEDVDKVPREYLTVAPGAVNAAVKGGVRKIPGIKIF